ncbi:MAG TPA: nucleotidyltransferase domain-containing protein [Armatimonadota bacterium]|jgi:predicted nucleotidyltransferase
MEMTTLNLPEDLRQALDQAVAAIVEIAHPELVILFGSWAEGTARPDSDVDLLVVADYAERGATHAALHRVLRSILGTREFDLLLYKPQEWARSRRLIGFVPHEADRYGVKLVERAA